MATVRFDIELSVRDLLAHNTETVTFSRSKPTMAQNDQQDHA